MFVRETSANGKISFWTIHPDANRYLTLDQVFKVSASCEGNRMAFLIPELQDVWLQLTLAGR